MLRLLPSALLILPLAGLLGWTGRSLAQSPTNYPYVYVEDANGGEPHFWRTNVVPLWPDKVCFGWTMAVEGRNRTVNLTEILTLSAPSTNWGHGPETVVENGNKAITHIKAPLANNRLARAWCIVEGDPPGQYRYDIYIDGQHRGEFVYCAVKVPDDGSVRIEDLKCPYKFESVERQDAPIDIKLASRTVSPPQN
jgi:hypothetical protein